MTERARQIFKATRTTLFWAASAIALRVTLLTYVIRLSDLSALVGL